MSIYYLVSSLPSFNFGSKPYYTSEGFVRLCADWINTSQQKELEELLQKNQTRFDKRIERTKKMWWDYCNNHEATKIKKLKTIYASDDHCA